MKRMLNLIIRLSVYALVLLMPVFWLPWTVEAFEFNKQYLLVGLASIAFLAWMAKMTVVRKKISVFRTPVDLLVLIFMIVVALSAVFSLDRSSSWLGFYGRFSDSAAGLFAVGMLYFVVVNNIRVEKMGAEETKQRTNKKPLSLGWISGLILTSGFLVVFFAYCSIFGVWTKIFGASLPRVVTLKSFNAASASLEGLSIFLVALMTLAAGKILSSKSGIKDSLFLSGQNKLRAKIYVFFSCLLLLAALGLLVLIDFKPAWVVLAVSMLLLLIISIWTRAFKRKVNLLTIPIVLLIISGVYLSGLFSSEGFLGGIFSFKIMDLPREAILDQKTSWTVAWQAVKEYPFLGSGPATLEIGFNRYKPIEFNQNIFWNIRFDRLSAYLMEVVVGTGITGFLVYILMAIMFLLLALAGLLKMKRASVSSDSGEALVRAVQSDSNKAMIAALPFVFAWLALFVAQFVYYQNSVLTFCSWLFMALVMAIWSQSKASPARIRFDFKKLPEAALVANIIFMVVIFGFVVLFYLGGQFYLADMKYKGLADDDVVLRSDMEEVVNLNKYRSIYRQSLSQIYLADAWAEASKPSEERDIQLLQNLTSGSVGQAKLATIISPSAVEAWENLGVIYRDMQGLIAGTIPFGLEAFDKASQLEPNNPVLFRERCRLGLRQEEKDWDGIISFCQKAVEMKPNYLDAQFQLALAYETKGDLERAVSQMQLALEKLKGVSFQRNSNLAVAATEIYFQMGRLHYNLKRFDEAIKMFEQSVIITPQYANGHYALALSYLAKERQEDALLQLEVVNELVPGNQSVEEAIRQLRGIPAAPVSETVDTGENTESTESAGTVGPE